MSFFSKLAGASIEGSGSNVLEDVTARPQHSQNIYRASTDDPASRTYLPVGAMPLQLTWPRRSKGGKSPSGESQVPSLGRVWVAFLTTAYLSNPTNFRSVLSLSPGSPAAGDETRVSGASRTSASEGTRPTTASTTVTTRVVVQRASQISLEMPNRSKPSAPLPQSWTTDHDRTLCYLDTYYTNVTKIIGKLKRKFPALEKERLTAEMIDVRLRLLDQDVEIDYWREALVRIDAASERETSRSRTVAESAVFRRRGLCREGWCCWSVERQILCCS